MIGWDWHQKQQRAILPADVIERRQKDVETIYTDPDPKIVHTLLRRYGVKYVYLGPLERLYYGSDGLPKFVEHARQGVGDNYWDLVYENPGVKIYQVRYDNPQS